MAKRSVRPGPVPVKQPAAEKTAAVIRYIETSALLAALLERQPEAIKALRAKGRRVTSRLTLAEGARAVRRARNDGRLTPQQERAALLALRRFGRRCYIVSVTDAVLERAGRPFPIEPICTLDAVHLATAELLESPQFVTMVTRDRRVQQNANALGYVVEG